MVTSRASIKSKFFRNQRAFFNIALGAAIVCLTLMTPAESFAKAPNFPASYAAPCIKSKEFSRAIKSQIEIRREITKKHYRIANRLLQITICQIDRYTDQRSYDAREGIFDDTGQDMMLARYLEAHGDKKKALHIRREMLTGAIASCRSEPKSTSEKLKNLIAR